MEDIEGAIAALDTAMSGGETSTQEPDMTDALEFFIGGKPQRIPSNAEIALKHDKEVQRVPLSKMVNGYRQVSHAEAKFAEAAKIKDQFTKTQTEYQKAQETLKGLEQYKALQEWSVGLEKQNPAGYKLLMETIDRIKNGTLTPEGTPDQLALNSTITDLRNQLEELRGWKSQFEEQQQREKALEDRKFVDNEIATIKKSFPEINLDEADENGIRLSTKVENWGADKGYLNFTDAFHAHFRDQIAAILVQRGKNEAVKGIKKDSAEGILARSSTPFNNGHPAEVSGKEYGDLATEALPEFLKLLGS